MMKLDLDKNETCNNRRSKILRVKDYRKTEI